MQVLTGLAVAELRASQWSDALEVLRVLYRKIESATTEEMSWTRRYFNSPEQVLLAEAVASFALDQRDDALAIVNRLDATPLALSAQLTAVAYHRWHGDRATAWQTLRAVRVRFPQEYAIVAEEARLLESEKSLREAEIVLEEYAKLHPQHLDSHLAVAVWRLEHGAADAAIAWLQTVASQFPKEISPRLLLADAVLAARNFDSADALIVELKWNPSANTSVTQLEARAALLRQGLREAAEVLSRSGTESERDPRLQYFRGEVAAADGRYSDSLSIYSRLLPYSDLRNVATWRILTSLAGQQTAGEAERQLIDILKSRPDDPLLLLAGVDLTVQQQKFDAAFSYLDRLGKLRPAGAEMPFRRAQLWAQKGDLAAAISEARQAVEADPEHIPSRLLLARLLVRNNEPLAAMEHVEHVIEWRPGTSDAYVLEAWSLFHQNRRDEALAVLRDQIARQPDQPATHAALASLLREVGQSDAAIQALRAGWERMPSNRVLFEPLVLALCEARKADEAFSLARRFAGDKPDLSSAVFLAELFLRGKAFEPARKLG